MKKLGTIILKNTIGILAVWIFDKLFAFFENTVEGWYSYKETRKIISKINKKHERVVIFLKRK